MKILNQFPFIPDKERTLQVIGCLPGSPLHIKGETCFDILMKEFDNYVLPKAAYCFEDNNILLTLLPRAEQEIYVLCTLGNQIDHEISCCFKEGRYFDGMLISVMADVYLFQMQEWVYNCIKEDCRNQGLQISSRFMPFDDIEAKCQLQIVEKLPIGVSLTSALMLQPIKTLSFVVGAGKEPLTREAGLTACKNCHMKECSFRFDELSVKM